MNRLMRKRCLNVLRRVLILPSVTMMVVGFDPARVFADRIDGMEPSPANQMELPLELTTAPGAEMLDFQVDEAMGDVATREPDGQTLYFDESGFWLEGLGGELLVQGSLAMEESDNGLPLSGILMLITRRAGRTKSSCSMFCRQTMAE